MGTGTDRFGNLILIQNRASYLTVKRNAIALPEPANWWFGVRVAGNILRRGWQDLGG